MLTTNQKAEQQKWISNFEDQHNCKLTIEPVLTAEEHFKLCNGFVSLFQQIETESEFIGAVSNDIDSKVASLLWHSLTILYQCEQDR